MCREIIIERHFRGKVNRSVAELFVEQVRKNKSPTDTPPIIATATHYLIHVYQHHLFFLAVVCYSIFFEDFLFWNIFF